MRIFVSWSGTYSKAIAELLREWVPNVIQEAVVYVSSQDIAKGETWPDSVRGNLSEIDLGVVVVTKSNFEAPWILFEAGALSKSVKSRMIPLLCGVEHIDLAKSPLRLFQSSLATHDDIHAMMRSLNTNAATPLTDERLNVAFEKWWPDFIGAYQDIEQDPAPVAKTGKKTDEAVLSALEALLGDVQSIKNQMRRERVRPANTLTFPSQQSRIYFSEGERANTERLQEELHRRDVQLRRLSRHGKAPGDDNSGSTEEKS